MIPKINSAHGSDTRNIINRVIEVLNQQGIYIQDLVAEGQLTEEQYAELISVINGLVKSGHIKRLDLDAELRAEVDEINNKINKGEVSVNDIDKNKGKIDASYLADSLLQMMAGETPINTRPENFSTTTVKLEDDAVTTDTTEFIKKSSNLFNVNQSTKNKIIGLSGEITDSQSYSVSDYIRVKPDTEYYFFGFYSVAKFDENGNFIRRRDLNVGGESLVMPSDFYYIRLNYKHNDSSSYRGRWKMNLGSEKPFERWYAHIDEDIEARSLIEGAVERDHIKDFSVSPEKTTIFKASTNLFDVNNVNELTNISPEGEDFTSLSYNSSNFIYVMPEHTYTFYGFLTIATFDADKNFIRRDYIDANGETLTMPIGVNYIRVQYQPTASYSNRRVNKGDTLLPYEDYYNKFEKGMELDTLNEIIEREKDRIMMDMPLDGIFSTNEPYGDYAWFNNAKHDEVYGMFDDFMTDHPDYVTKEHLGDDEWGNPINIYKYIPDYPPSDIETKKIKIFITGGVHGYEHMGTLAIYLLMKQIADKWESNPLLEALRWNVEFIIMPVCNPSGWDSYIRHNANDVDINRNFPAGWHSIAPNPGPEPASELETQYIMSIIDSEDLDIMIDFHNFHSGSNGDYFTWIPSPNAYLQHMSQIFFSRMTRKWRKDFNFVPSNNYFAGYSSTGASGGTVSTYARKKGIKHTVTFEICNVWELDENGTVNDENVCIAGVEALGNWLLINIKELMRV